jgi:hypothetical protein
MKGKLRKNLSKFTQLAWIRGCEKESSHNLRSLAEDGFGDIVPYAICGVETLLGTVGDSTIEDHPEAQSGR